MKQSDTKISEHKKMAMGMACGGMVRGSSAPMVPKPTGKPNSPLTNARRNNGVPGMKGGGCVKK